MNHRVTVGAEQDEVAQRRLGLTRIGSGIIWCTSVHSRPSLAAVGRFKIEVADFAVNALVLLEQVCDLPSTQLPMRSQSVSKGRRPQRR